ncbi:hypothetical protein TALC_01012 [Thermoplasmatales archaeon BRNA1]|nr:hypothetical protein TALC_01012 [Thermoplasmatales archaeon BRNA1]
MDASVLRGVEKGLLGLTGEMPMSVEPPDPSDTFPVQIAIYPPTPSFWFWKIATVGACESENPPFRIGGRTERKMVRRRNEFIIFLPAEWGPEEDREKWDFHIALLKKAAAFHHETGGTVMLGSILPLEHDGKVQYAFMAYPHVFGPGTRFFFSCGPLRSWKVACLQVIPISSEDAAAAIDETSSNTLYQKYYGVDPLTGMLQVRYHWEFQFGK